MKKKILSAIMIIAMMMSLNVNTNIYAETEIEAGNSLENAVEIGFDTEYVSNLEAVGEEDWYKFTAPAEGYYDIRVDTYTGDHKCVLICTEYEKELFFRGYWEPTTNAELKLENSKVYFIKVYAYNYKDIGKYSVSVTYKTDDVGDSYNNAKSISINKKYEDELDGGDDVDFFCFDGNKGTKYSIELIILSAKALIGDGGRKIIIYDNDMNILTESNTDGRGSSQVISVDSSDKYYIEIQYRSLSKIDNRADQKYSLMVTEEGEKVPSQPAICSHNNTSEEYIRESFEKNSENNHTKITYYKKTCDDCGVVVSEYSRKNDESHNFSGNSCYNCNYVKEIVPEKDTISPEIYEFYCDTGSVVNRNQTSTITFTARARDNVGVSRISLVKNYLTIAENTGSSLTATIQTDGLSLGQNDMYIIAYDAAGNYAYSNSIYITVTENTPSNNGEISVYVDGQKIYFDVPPQIINNRTMVPIRAIFEAMGATVEWDGTIRSVLAQKWYKTGGIIFVRFYIDSNIMYNSFGSGQHTIDSPATIIDGRTLVPARAAAESFDYNVSWDEYTRTVYITSK